MRRINSARSVILRRPSHTRWFLPTIAIAPLSKWGINLQRQLSSLVIVCLACVRAGGATSQYQLDKVGLTDSLHTGSDGSQTSEVLHVDSSGRAFGTSQYYGLSGIGRLQSIWYFDPTTLATIRIDPSNTEHTGLAGRHIASLNDANSTGQAIGTSARYDANGNLLGDSAWVYDSTSNQTRSVGLFDAFHTRADGAREAFPAAISDSHRQLFPVHINLAHQHRRRREPAGVF